MHLSIADGSCTKRIIAQSCSVDEALKCDITLLHQGPYCSLSICSKILLRLKL